MHPFQKRLSRYGPVKQLAKLINTSGQSQIDHTLNDLKLSNIEHYDKKCSNQ